MKHEFYDPVALAFRAKLVRRGVLIDCRFRGLRRGRAGGSKSFGRFHFVCRSVLVTLVVRAACVIYLSTMLSSGPPGGCPHARLKAGMPREALTPAPTTKTPVPTTVNQCSTRAEATRRVPTFKTMVKRVDCAALGAPHQHQEATSHQSSQVGARTYHW